MLERKRSCQLFATTSAEGHKANYSKSETERRERKALCDFTYVES